jgi:hypothetical protein
MLLHEYEIEFMFRKIRNIRNLGNVYNRGSSIELKILKILNINFSIWANKIQFKNNLLFLVQCAERT